MAGYNTLIQAGISRTQPGYSSYKNTLMRGIRALTGSKLAPSIGRLGLEFIASAFSDYFDEEDEEDEEGNVKPRKAPETKFTKNQKRELFQLINDIRKESEWQSKAISMYTKIPFHAEYFPPPPVAPPVAPVAPVAQQTPAPRRRSNKTKTPDEMPATVSLFEYAENNAPAVADPVVPSVSLGLPAPALHKQIGAFQPLPRPLISNTPIEPMRPIGPITLGQSSFSYPTNRALDVPRVSDYEIMRPTIRTLTRTGSMQPLGGPLL